MPASPPSRWIRPPLSSRAARAVVAVACALGLALAGTLACGGGSGAASRAVHGRVLAVYSSAPLRGSIGPAGRDVVAAERLALVQAHHRVGRFRVVLRARDASEPGADGWTPRQVAANARRAAADPETIAYLGELDTGASAVSLPTLNETGILQVSPGDTLVGLTRDDQTGIGEPAKYYPTGRRTFARIVPDDDVQVSALVADLRAHGARRVYVVDDERLYGQALADRFGAVAPAAGLRVVVRHDIDPSATDFRSLARDVRTSGADAVLFTGTAGDRAVALWRALARIDSGLELFGPEALARPAFYRRLGAAAARTHLTSPVLPPRLDGRGAREFARAFERRYGRRPQPLAIYGYEAMKLVLAGLGRAGDHAASRAAVVRAVLATHDRRSVIGRYSIDRHGDTTRTAYAGYDVRDGRLVFDRLLGGPGAGGG